MKLSTMILPNGHFVLVASNCENTDLETCEALEDLRKSVGAVAGLAYEGEVEVEDALVNDAVARIAQVNDVSFEHLFEAFDEADELLRQDNERAREVQEATAERDDLIRRIQADTEALGGGEDILTSQVEEEPYEPQVGDKVVVCVEGSLYGTQTLPDDETPLFGAEMYVTGVRSGCSALDSPVVELGDTADGDGWVLLDVKDVLPVERVDG